MIGVKNVKKFVCAVAIVLSMWYFFCQFRGEEDSLGGLSDEIVSSIADSPAAEVFGMEGDEVFLV